MSGGIVALVPIRSLTGGKTRLAGVLSQEARSALTARMVTRVIHAALSSDAIVSVVVVSPDPAALALASGVDARVDPVVQTSDRPGLLAALDLGREHAHQRGASGLLVLFGDLPLLDGDDVRNLVRRAVPIVIAPDRHGEGTNALFLRLSAMPEGDSFAFQFGEESYPKHVSEAHRLGLDVATSVGAGTAFDLDTPEDLAALMSDATWIEGETGRDLVASLGLEGAA